MRASQTKIFQGMPVLAEVLSFLKDTKGALRWTTKDLTSTLRITVKEAEQVLAVMEMQGYVQRVQGTQGEWLTTAAGETVSGSKTPRFSRESIEKGLAELGARIKALNKNSEEEFQVTEAVAFGDFLCGFCASSARLQAVDVGIQWARRDPEVHDPDSFVEQRSQQALLRKLRAKSALLNLRPYEEWMSHRSHRKLL
jgi:hypothetical protein